MGMSTPYDQGTGLEAHGAESLEEQVLEAWSY